MSARDDDGELALIAVAFEALSHLGNRQAWQRALDYIANRLCEHERGEFLRNPLRDLPPPTQYVFAGNLDERFFSPDEAEMECGNTGDIIEVNGVAIVSQTFGVRVSILDAAGDVDDTEVHWFDTRAIAETYLTEMCATPPEDTAHV